jgi:hypothetical protein
LLSSVRWDAQVVVVLSGSMEPGFKRGDILFLNMGTAPVRTGAAVVAAQRQNATSTSNAGSGLAVCS